MKETIQQIDGIDQFDTAPKGATAYAKRYYSDNEKDLLADLKALPIRERYCIVPRDGWPKQIYLKPEAKKPKSKKAAKRSRSVTVDRMCWVSLTAPDATEQDAYEILEELFGEEQEALVEVQGITLKLSLRKK